jgi:hypothetical protein
MSIYGIYVLSHQRSFRRPTTLIISPSCTVSSRPFDLLFKSCSCLIVFRPRRGESDKAKVEYGQLDYNIIHNNYTRKQIADVKTHYRTTYTRWLTQNEEVYRFKENHQIETRWSPNSPEYNDALVIVSQHTYRKALDDLERIFVQHLLELTKLGMNGVGTLVHILWL